MSGGAIRVGLLGFPLGHSFSGELFEGWGVDFRMFEYADCGEFIGLLRGGELGNLRGFGVTIPHKLTVIEHLDWVDDATEEVGAVNCVVVASDGTLCGYNTDSQGFTHDFKSLTAHLPSSPKVAVLGSGGASRAVVWALRHKLNITDITVVSRGNSDANSYAQTIDYQCFNPANFDVIINTTPLGMMPNCTTAPAIDYRKIRPGTVCYDLVYNPSMTEFLRRCKAQNAVVKGGIGMLIRQAEVALQHYEAQR